MFLGTPLPVSLHIEHSGSGPVVVLTHGLADDSSTWGQVPELLAREASVITWDLRGHGKSDRPDDRDAYSPEIAAADLEAVVASVESRVVLVGHSLGGYLSLNYALKHPSRVRALLLLCSGPGFRQPEAIRAWNRWIDRVAERGPVPDAAGRLGHQVDAWTVDHCEELVPPLLHIVGTDDTRYLAGAEYLREKVAGSRLVLLEDAGHHPQQGHPEVVAQAILEYCRTPQT